MSLKVKTCVLWVLLDLDMVWLGCGQLPLLDFLICWEKPKKSSEERDVLSVSHILPHTCLSFFLLRLPVSCGVPAQARTLCGLHGTKLQPQPGPHPSSFRQLPPDVCALSWPGRVLAARARKPSNWCHPGSQATPTYLRRHSFTTSSSEAPDRLQYRV